MSVVPLACLIALIISTSLDTLSAPARDSVSFGPQEAKSDASSTFFEAWVVLRDKGVITSDQESQIKRRLEKEFHPRALKRRRLRRTRSGLFDEMDFPLDPSYLRSIAATGAEIRVQSRWFNGVSILASEKQIHEISALPFVSEVTDFHTPMGKGKGKYVSPPEDPSEIRHVKPDAELGPYGLSRLQVEQLNLERMHQRGYAGKGVVIAVLDCGFDLDHIAFTHPNHKINVLAQWDFMDNDGVASPEKQDPPTQHRHGTYVLGALAAYLPEVLMGTAYDADFILCKAESDAEEFLLEERWFVAALEFAEKKGADVISSSCGLYDHYSPDQMDGKTSVMALGWKLAVENGVIGLQGVGNHGHDQDSATNHIFPPGDAVGVISCGAVLPDGQIARFSSDGPTVDDRIKPELLALGAGVWTIAIADKTGFLHAAGTSMATPLLAGAAACLLQAHPQWTVEQVRQALFRSGDYFRLHGKPDPLNIYGYGIPDVFLAAGLKR